jgi:hypothetical protein
VVRVLEPGHDCCLSGARVHIPVPRCSVSKYGFRASGVRTRASADPAETGFLPKFLSSVLNRPSQEVRRELASGKRFLPVAASGQSTGLPEHSRKPANQRGGRSGGERGSYRNWRMGWDSNPRYAFTYTHFPGVRLRPLGHPSSRWRTIVRPRPRINPPNCRNQSANWPAAWINGRHFAISASQKARCAAGVA